MKDNDTAEQIYRINYEAAEYYHSLLLDPAGKPAKEFLTSKEISDETIEKYKLGYSGSSPDGLVRHLKGIGYTMDQITEAKLAEKGNEDADLDVFQNRMIVPIIDDENRVTGFGGRTVIEDSPIWLILHSSNVLDKNKSLFGIDHAMKSEADYIIICEGFMDAIIMQQAGFDMTTSLLGCRLTPEHTELIKKYTDKVVLCYDGDYLGEKEADKAREMLIGEGLSAVTLISPRRDCYELLIKTGFPWVNEL